MPQARNMKQLNDIDTHGGFLNDGTYFAKIKCMNINYNQLSNNWKKLPLSDSLKMINDMEYCDKEGCFNIYEKYNIPNITNGYYYFIDKNNIEYEYYITSLNFILALFDKDTNIIYYYELDS